MCFYQFWILFSFYEFLLIVMYYIYLKYFLSKILYFTSFYYDVGNITERYNVGRNDVRWIEI